MKKENLKIGDVEIEVTFKAIKNLHLSVHPHGRVTILLLNFMTWKRLKFMLQQN